MRNGTAVSSQQTSQENPLADFGPNEWVVEDMYQRYLADPAGVDPAWHEFFADYRPVLDGGGPQPVPGPAAGDGAAGAADRAATVRGTAPVPSGSVAAPAHPAAAPTTPAKPAAPAKPAGPSRGPTAGAPARTAVAAPPAPAGKPAPAKPAAEPSRADNGATVPLRGAAARIVQNMDASLGVPTATSVRAVPAKLIADNRI